MHTLLIEDGTAIAKTIDLMLQAESLGISETDPGTTLVTTTLRDPGTGGRLHLTGTDM